MKTPDYLNSDRLREPHNFEVYQNLYGKLNQASYELMEIIGNGYGMSNKDKAQYMPIVFQIIENAVTDSVNEAIHKFEK